MYTERFSEAHDLIDSIFPVSTSTQVNGAWVDVKDFHRIVAKLKVGAIAATGTLVFQIQQATSAAGAGAKALKAAPSIGDTADNRDIWLEVKAEELDVDGGFRFVRIEAIAATAASIISAELLGVKGRYSPAAQPAATVLTVIP